MDNPAAKKTPRAPSIFNMELITSAIIPLIIFHVFNYRGLVLAGTIVSGCWCLGLLAIKYACDCFAIRGLFDYRFTMHCYRAKSHFLFN